MTRTIGDIKIKIENKAKMIGQTLWRQEGPEGTIIRHHAMLMFGATMIYVQSFEDGGWEAFVQATTSNETKATFDAILSHINADEMAGAQ